MSTTQKPQPCENQAVVGVDLGIKTLATLSNGNTVQNIRPLKKYLDKLKRQQRALSRRQKGSQNREKSKKAVARLHYKIACLRNDRLIS